MYSELKKHSRQIAGKLRPLASLTHIGNETKKRKKFLGAQTLHIRLDSIITASNRIDEL